MEFLKHYNFFLQYHLGKANVIADALSQRPHSLISSFMIREWQALETIIGFDLQLLELGERVHFGCLIV